MEHREPVRLDGEHLAPGQGELLRAQGGPVPEGQRHDFGGGGTRRIRKLRLQDRRRLLGTSEQ